MYSQVAPRPEKERVLSFQETVTFSQLCYKQETEVKEFKTIKDKDKKINKRWKMIK